MHESNFFFDMEVIMVLGLSYFIRWLFYKKYNKKIIIKRKYFIKKML